MTTAMSAPKLGKAVELNFLCCQVGEAWRVYARPTRLPGFLRKCFDEQYQVYPAYLDFEDLDAEMKAKGGTYTKHVSSDTVIELTATGEAAVAMANWLADSFTSNVRCGAAVKQGEAGTGQTG